MDNKKVGLRGGLLWLLVATSFAFVVVQLDVTIVNVALPRIGAALHAGVAGLQWVVDAYTLSFAALLISAGVIGDRFGSRRIYLIGFLIFTAASIVCGFAPTIGILIAARALQGAGAALLVPTSLAILNHSSEENPALRARMVALWTAAGGVSIAAGPVAGGFLLAGFGWRSIFLVNIVLCGIGIFLVLKFVQPDFQGLDLQRNDLRTRSSVSKPRTRLNLATSTFPDRSWACWRSPVSSEPSLNLDISASSTQLLSAVFFWAHSQVRCLFTWNAAPPRPCCRCSSSVCRASTPPSSSELSSTLLITA